MEKDTKVTKPGQNLRPKAIELIRPPRTFKASLEPANGQPLHIAYLIVRDQMVYPLLQGFLWAVAKDWYQVAAAFTRLHGQAYGRELVASFNEWLALNNLRLPSLK